MQSIIKIFFLFLILGLLFLFSTSGLTLFKENDAVSDFQTAIAAEAPGKNKQILPESGHPPFFEMSEGQDYTEQKWQLLTGILRWDIYEILVGTLLSVIGLAAIALALFRWKPKDLSLITFGIFCFLIGARTNAVLFFFEAAPWFGAYWKSSITYIVPLSVFVFMEQLLGKGWKSSIRLMIYASIVFAIAAISVGIALKAPYTAMLANNFFAILVILVILANMFWPGLKMPNIRILTWISNPVIGFF